MKSLVPLILIVLAPGAWGRSAQNGLPGPLARPSKVASLLAEPLPVDMIEKRSDLEDGAVRTLSGRIELHARDQTLQEVFSQIQLASHMNILVDPTVKAKFTGDIFDMSPKEAIEMICRATSTVAEDHDGYLMVRPLMMESRVYVLHNIRAQDITELVKPILSEGGKATSSTLSQQGIESSQTEAGGDDYANDEVLVVRDLPEVLDKVQDLIEVVDKEPRQVLVEATILSAKLIDGMEMGVEFTQLRGVNFQTIGATSPDGQSVVSGGLDSSQLEGGVQTLGTAVAEGLSTAGLSYGLIKGDTAAFVRALQSITDTTVLANPKVVTLNKQRGEVLLGRRDGYLTTTVSETTTTQTVEYIETGTRLVFRPFIGSNGNIRLEIHPEDSDGGISPEGLPFKDTAEVTTNILCHDGDRIVIGGLFRNRKESTESRVPLLADIPLLGKLFQGTIDTTTREEVIIILTPHILEPKAPKDEGGAVDLDGMDREPAKRLYLHTAQALSMEGSYASALLLLDAAGRLRSDSPEIRALHSRMTRALIPDRAGPVVDPLLVESLQSAENGK